MRKLHFDFAIAGSLIVGLFACGVKGPPLPPVADTPNASDRVSVSGSAPSPTPSPSSTPKPKKKKRH